MERALRFRARGGKSFRRAGLAFGPDWVEIDPAAADPQVITRLAAEPRLVAQIQGEEHGVWEDLPEAARDMARAQLDVLDARDWAEIRAEARPEGPSVVEIAGGPAVDLPRLTALEGAFEENAGRLAALAALGVLWGGEVEPSTLVALIDLAEAQKTQIAALGATQPAPAETPPVATPPAEETPPVATPPAEETPPAREPAPADAPKPKARTGGGKAK
jgi:hypothetical protein